jgi:hypothetical protein
MYFTVIFGLVITFAEEILLIKFDLNVIVEEFIILITKLVTI